MMRRSFSMGSFLVLASAGGLFAQTAGWAPLRTFAIAFGTATAYDPGRQRIMQFGGGLTALIRHRCDETWEWDGDRWLPRYPRTTPAARIRGACAFDYVRNRVILFGGADQLGRTLGDMWEWDGEDWSRIQVPVMPGAREAPSMAADPLRQRIVLFGGRDIPTWTFFNDTWEWDGTRWQQASPTTLPSPRGGARMAYCLANQRMVLYGGGGNGRLVPDPCYEWDGSNWTRRTTGNPPVFHGELVSAPWNGHVLLHSGIDVVNNAYVYRLDTWDYDGSAWRQVPTTRWPGWRPGVTLCEFPPRQEVAFFNGKFDGGTYNPATNEQLSSHPGTVPNEYEHDMWFFRQNDWHYAPRNLRKRLDVILAAHDSARDSTVVIVNEDTYSGYPNPTMQTWALDGSELHELNVVNPPRRLSRGLAYHPGLQRVVLYGGRGYNTQGAVSLYDTWMFDGTQWVQDLSPNHPVLFWPLSMIYDVSTDCLLMTCTGESTIWRWQGNGWTPWPAAQLPVINNNALLECDPVRRRLVMWGYFRTQSGAGTGRVTYEFDGTSWQQKNPVHTPPPTARFKFLRYVPWLGGVVLIGQDGSAGTWVWDGTDWHLAWLDREMFNGFDGMSCGSVAAAYSETRGELQVFQCQLGGMDGSGSLVWTLRRKTLLASSQHPRLSGSFGFSFDVPQQPGGLAAVLFSGSDHPGIDVGCADGRWLPLADRPMLHASLGFGLWTVLDAAGHGAVRNIGVPNSTSLIGFSMFAAGLVLDPSTWQLATATNALPIDVNP